MDITWSTSIEASALRNLESEVVPRDIEEDSEVAAEWRELRALFAAFASSAFVSSSTLLQQLIPLSTRIHAPRELAQAALNKLIGRDKSEPRVAELARILTTAKGIYSRANPQAEEDLNGSLARNRALWGEQGAHTIRTAGLLLPPGILAEHANLAIIDTAGSGGTAYPSHNLVCWEMSSSDLLQLTWLVSTLNLDLPRFRENLQPRSAEWICALAMIPVVVASHSSKGAERTISPQEIAEVMGRWIPDGGNENDVAEKLSRWWETYSDRRPAWETALLALERYLSPATDPAMV
ncbi:MAG: hypothetical protein U1D30_11020 [Planctomycetota bacterium]